MTQKRTTRFVIATILLLTLFSPLMRAYAGGICGGTYIVESGDTIEKIAATCGTTVYAITSANPGISSTLVKGQSILVPGYNYGTQINTPVPQGYTIYVIQPGDTFTGIASRFNVTVYDLWQANLNIQDINLLTPGQVMVIPASSLPVTQTPIPTVEPTSGPLSYGTVPFGTEKAKVYLFNKSKSEVYVSLQGTTKDGYNVIYEYPVGGGLTVKVPSGKYVYVAWVGGAKFSGSFNLNAENDRVITFYKDKVEVK